MSTTTMSPVPARSSLPTRAPAPIPLTRLVTVELRKAFDTRAGFWLLASIAITAALASTAVVLWAPDDVVTYETFGSAIGFPMTVVLPVIAILSVTSEWSQRSGLTTFTLAPRRGRVILAKGLAVALVSVTGTVVAFAIGALGNLAGSSLAGVDATWDIDVASFFRIMLAMGLAMAVGFMLGLLLRSSPGALVAYFVYSFALPPLLLLLANVQSWFEDLQPWVDFNVSSSRLYDTALSAEQWAQLGVTGLIWLVVPLTVGVWLTARSEVK